MRFIDNNDGSVTDTTTNLMWKKEDDGQERSQKDAIAYCESLGNGWRAPTVEELRTLVDYTRYGPAIDPIFTKTKSDYYWTSTPCAFDSFNAWFVYFNFGNVNWNVVSGEHFVRPVRQNS